MSEVDPQQVPPTVSGAPTEAAPDVEPTAAPTYWATADAPRRGGSSKLLLVVGWLTAIGLAAFNAWLATRSEDLTQGSPRWQGYLVGASLAPFIIAFVARAAFVLIARRRGTADRSIARSAWVPLGATILVGVSLISNITSLVPAAPVDTEALVRVRAPFTLREASTETRDLAQEALKTETSLRSYSIREVVGDDGSVSVLLVADAGLRAGDLDDMARGIEDAAGVTSTTESIGGHQVVMAIGEQIAMGSWIEEPVFYSVYAADEPTLRAVIDAVHRAPVPTAS